MKIGLGFFCSTSDNKISTNHVIRLKNLNYENFHKTLDWNLRDFLRLLDISRDMGLSIFRLGSNVIPFASHPVMKREWLREAYGKIRGLAPRVRSYGIRITMHPGQYVVLNSPRRGVVERSLVELQYHFEVLDSLGVGSEGIVVIHVGGVYGDRENAIKRFYSTIEENKWLLKRLAIENDERYYTVSDVLEIGETLGIPVVYDHYHHVLNPSRFSVDRLISTWRNQIPEVHLSSRPLKGRFGEHGDYVELGDFIDLVNIFMDIVEVDVVIEAKMKEKAIQRLLREIREKHPELAIYLKTNPTRNPAEN